VNLVLIEQAELVVEGDVRLGGPRAKHLREVLRVEVGSTVRVGLVDGPIGTARVAAIEGEDVRLVCSLVGAAPERPRIDLLLALPRPKVLRRLWPQLAALGVGKVVLTNASRVERFYFDASVLEPREVRAELLDGLSQARDTRVPLVEVRRAFKPLVEDELEALFGGARRLLCDPGYERSVGAALASPTHRAVLGIGPEGGWTPYERALLERHGFEGVGLGPRTLRSDTATIALLAIAHEALRSAAPAP
jgi:RsmE family RNA methyltransferase